MYEDKKILAIIPARGGSKGVLKKNIRPLNGKPLIFYTIEQALLSAYIDRIVVTSDSDEILETVTKEFSVKVEIILRPEDLAADDCKMLPVLQHAVSFIENQQQKTFETIVLLQPTSPLRSASDIDESIALLWKRPAADSVLGFIKAESIHPVRFKKIVNGYVRDFGTIETEGTNRQDREPVFMRNGAIYTYQRSTLMEQKSIWGKQIRALIMPEERSVEIDTEFDFKFAECLIQEMNHE